MRKTVTCIAVLGLLSFVEPALAKKADRVHHVLKTGTSHKAVKKGESRTNSSVRNATQLSEDQQRILQHAYKVAKKDGLKNPAILSGIIMQESKAGVADKMRTSRHKSSRDQSVGVAQLLDSTAKSVLKEYPELRSEYHISDREIHKRLATDDNFNIAIASKYLKTLYAIRNDDTWVVGAYNRGPGAVGKTPWKLPYVKSVFNYIARYKTMFC